MVARFRYLAFAVVVALFPGPASGAAAANTIQPVNLAALVTDLDLAPKFIAGDKLLYRLGAPGAAQIMLADPLGASQMLVQEAVLKAKVAASGVKLSATESLIPIDYDDATKVLKLRAGEHAWTYDLTKATLITSPVMPFPHRRDQTDVMSPDGKHKIITRDYNLFVVDTASGKEMPLTTDGNYDRRYGTNYPLLADMVAANSETPPITLAAQWSEDSKRILTYRLSRNNAFIWHAVQQNPPESRFPRTFAFVYPTAGAKDVPQVQPVVIDVEHALTKKTAVITELKVPSLSLLWPGDPPMWWESGQVMYQWTARGYGEIKLYAVDPATGEATLQVREAVKPLVTVTSSAIRSAPELGGYLNISERSGWAQLYYIRKGENPDGGKALTSGAWEVSEIQYVAKDEPILLTGNGREPGVNPYYHSLYSVTLDGNIRNLTPEPLDHHVTLSEDGKWFVDRMSAPAIPTRTSLRSASDGHVVATLGTADPAPLLAAGYTPGEPFQTLADDGKSMLYGLIFCPKNFDAKRKYPVIDLVYTGPTTHSSAESFDQSLGRSENILTQTGSIVVVIDGRGTSQRGQAFRLPAYQNMGEVGIDDHISVLKAMQAKYPYFDLSRVGVYGHSAGGYDAARFILRRPEFFKAAVASAGVHDLRLDKAWWPEVTMGLADDATWERNSNIGVAKNLKGKLLLVHGDIDDNVPITATMRLHNALVEAGKLHDFVIMPNRTHNTFTPYYWHMVGDFFRRNLVEAK